MNGARSGNSVFQAKLLSALYCRVDFQSAVLETSTCEEGMSKVAKTEDMAHGVERALDLR